MELLHDPAIPGNIIRRIENRDSKDTCKPMLTAEFFTVSNRWKESKSLSMDRWIKKKLSIYPQGNIFQQ